MGVNVETIVMAGAALAGVGNVQGQEAHADERTISWEEAQNLNKVQKLITECQLRVADVCPDYSKETDLQAKLERLENNPSYRSAEAIKSETFIKLRQGLANGDFNVDEVAMAANWMRENYDNGYDLRGVEIGAKESLVITGHTVDENAPNAVPVKGILDGKIIAYVDAKEADEKFLNTMRGHKNSVDAEATRAAIDAIDNDASLSAEDKNNRKLEEARGYCERVDADYSSDHSEKNRGYIKGNVLRYHPELAAQLEREGTSGNMQEERADASNVEKIMKMNPMQGAKLVSNRVQKGAENVGVDTSISANAPKMNEGVDAKQQGNQQGKELNSAVLAQMQSRAGR